MNLTFELTTELLEPAVRRFFAGDDVKVIGFDIKALKPGAGNPVSLGVYRVSGTAEHQTETKPFSLVVKHLADGRPFMDASSPTGWNFWRREIEFFESPLVERIPLTLGHPTYLGQSLLADGSALFWNGDLGDLETDEWTWEDCLNAVRIVAELNSAKSDDLSDYPWLNRSQVEGWAKLHQEWQTFDANYPMLLEITQSAGDFANAEFVKYLNRPDYIGGILKGGRHSLVHGDFNLNNLVPTKGAVKLLALDWQLCGEARIGTEIAAVLNTAIERHVIEPNAESFETLCETYTESFNALNQNQPIALDEVRLAAAAMGYFIMVNMPLFFMNFPAPESEDERRERLHKMATDFLNGPVNIYAKVLSSLE